MSVLSEVYKRVDIEIDTDLLPAKRSIRSANEGVNYDGELFRINGVEKEYTNLIPIKVPLHQSKWMVYTKNKKIKVNGWQNLKQYKLSIRRGISTTKKGTEGFNTIIVNTNKQLFEL
ncbi:MAG: polar amino acid transport system substrate-binding protein [Alteromonadaceae bacterium]|jgi:polar amino acid transport system substrate-binding protein